MRISTGKRMILICLLPPVGDRAAHAAAQAPQVRAPLSAGQRDGPRVSPSGGDLRPRHSRESDRPAVRRDGQGCRRPQAGYRHRRGDPKRYNSYNVTHPTYKALAEVGKAEKTIFLCEYLASRDTQREVHDGLNVVENWNATNDFICYGRQGELATNSREQQEIVTLSLQLVQNCLMLINTLLLERTIERDGFWERLSAEDLRALTPLFHGHINPYGQFTLDLARPSFLEVA